MIELSVLHYHRADWEIADSFVHTALCTNAGLLRVTNVHVGQGGNIQFDVTPFISSSGGAPSILTAALTLAGAQLETGIEVELHGHFNTVPVPQRRNEYRRELRTIAFKLTQPDAERARYLGWVYRNNLDPHHLRRLEDEINKRRWLRR